MTDTTVGTKTVEFDGTIESAYGMQLDKALPYDGTYEHILDHASIPAKELPDNDDILTLVNNKRKANARQKAMKEVLDAAGIKAPTLETSQALQLSTMVKSLVASGRYDNASAEKFAKQALGIA